jgi:DNA-binding beta-propeller fold protein YncE
MDNIIVTCKYNGETNSSVPSVHVLDRQGTVVRVIEKNGRGEHLFIDPNYIALNASTQVIYVSDQGSKEIVCLSVSGTIFTRFSAVNFDPMGITVDESNGNVFVSNKVSVIQFNRNLKRMKTIKCRETTMENVITLTQCSKSDRLIVNKNTSPYLTVFTV